MQVLGPRDFFPLSTFSTVLSKLVTRSCLPRSRKAFYLWHLDHIRAYIKSMREEKRPQLTGWLSPIPTAPSFSPLIAQEIHPVVAAGSRSYEGNLSALRALGTPLPQGIIRNSRGLGALILSLDLPVVSCSSSDTQGSSRG